MGRFLMRGLGGLDGVATKVDIGEGGMDGGGAANRGGKGVVNAGGTIVG